MNREDLFGVSIDLHLLHTPRLAVEFPLPLLQDHLHFAYRTIDKYITNQGYCENNFYSPPLHQLHFTAPQPGPPLAIRTPRNIQLTFLLHP